MFHTKQAFYELFVLPELKPIVEAFEELAKTELKAEEILEKLKETCQDLSIIHWSFEEKVGFESPLDLRAAEILELIHTKEGLPECESSSCKFLREKLKKKA